MKPLRKRNLWDYYPTPPETIHLVLAALPMGLKPKVIYDAGAGKGEWGPSIKECYPKSWLVGIELYNKPNPKLRTAYDRWMREDYLQLFSEEVPLAKELAPDLILGNPPYKLAEAFIRKSLLLLESDGVLLFLLRLAYLESADRGYGLWKDIPPQDVWVLSERPSFTGDGKTDATAYAIYSWQKGHRPPNDVHGNPMPNLHWLLRRQDLRLE